jgi:hypothetical protein
MIVLLTLGILLDIALIFALARIRRLENDLDWWRNEAQRLDKRLRE